MLWSPLDALGRLLEGVSGEYASRVIRCWPWRNGCGKAPVRSQKRNQVRTDEFQMPKPKIAKCIGESGFENMSRGRKVVGSQVVIRFYQGKRTWLLDAVRRPRRAALQSSIGHGWQGEQASACSALVRLGLCCVSALEGKGQETADTAIHRIEGALTELAAFVEPKWLCPANQDQF